MNRKVALSLLILGIIAAFYFAGPRPAELILEPDLPELPQTLAQWDEYLAQRESQFKLREDNQARIIWADSLRKTDYVFLYIHGFSASQGEGAPAHENLARAFGANLLLARLAGHGYRENQLDDFGAQSAWRDAKEFLSIATKLGEKVIVMSTSTGCSYALNLALEFPEAVHALINLSPNIRVKDPTAKLLNDPWGEEIAEIVLGEKRKVLSDSLGHQKYWDTLYTVRALVEMQHLLESTLTEERFAQIHQPCLNLCYYKNEEEQDPVVSVAAMVWMHEHLGTADKEKRFVRLADVGNHVLASPIKSKDVAGTENAIEAFIREVLEIAPVK